MWRWPPRSVGLGNYWRRHLLRADPTIPPEIRPLFLPEYPYFSRFPAVELSGRLGDFCTGPFRSSRCLVGKVRGRDRIYLSRL